MVSNNDSFKTDTEMNKMMFSILGADCADNADFFAYNVIENSLLSAKSASSAPKKKSFSSFPNENESRFHPL